MASKNGISCAITEKNWKLKTAYRLLKDNKANITTFWCNYHANL